MTIKRNPLIRLYGRGDLHFVTFSCYRRRPLLASGRSRETFLRVLDELRNRDGFRVLGYVVMPEHVHLLLSEPVHGDLSKTLQVLKQKVSRELNGDGDGPFWQRRFYDFNVRSREKVKEKLEYMHANPSVRGLVENPREWVWSSWSHYAKRDGGLLPHRFLVDGPLDPKDIG